MTRSDAIALNAGGQAKGDAAIICVNHDRNWVLSSLLQELKKASQWKEFGEKRKLFFDVLVVKQKVRVDKLKKYIDNNRCIVITITRKFLADDNALDSLQIIYDTCRDTPREKLLIILIDALPWNGLPSILQLLVAEKNFIQYPLEQASRQLFYFWEAVRSEILRSPTAPGALKKSTNMDGDSQGTSGGIGSPKKGTMKHTQDFLDDIYRGISELQFVLKR